jgi:hypothetical protein
MLRPEKVIVRDCDGQWRIRDDSAFEWSGKGKACGNQEKQCNQHRPIRIFIV